jgi:hypothetical protein
LSYRTLGKRLFAARALPLFAAALVGSAVIAYPTMFSAFKDYDDVGHVLIGLKGFIAAGHLYDQVYSQYGPFYFELWGGLFSLFGIDVTHDSGGMATLVYWLLISLLIGFGTYRVTGSALLGVAVQLLTLKGTGLLVFEPMHPGGTAVLLLSLMTVASTYVDSRPRVAMLAIGASTAAIGLTKPNVGGFTLLGVALACAATYQIPPWRRWVRPLIEICCIAVPVALMARQLDQGWVRAYAVFATIAIVAVVVALRAWGPPWRRESLELRWLAGGLVGCGGLVLLVAMLTGSGPVDLARGIVIDPFEQPNIRTGPLILANQLLVLDVVALLICVGLAWLGRRETVGRIGLWIVLPGGRLIAEESVALVQALLGLVAGFAIGLSGAGVHLPYTKPWEGTFFFYGGLWPLGLAWISLLPTRAGAKPEMEFARRLIPALAVLESLHAFPIAGAQVQWGSFLLLPLAAISFDNGLRDLADLTAERLDRSFRLAVPAVFAVVTVLVANATIREPLHFTRTVYDYYQPLDLAGASRLRLDPNVVHTYRAIAREIQQRCSSFLSLPGLNSFYLWTDERPPTWLNANDWMFQLDTDRQQRIVDAVRGSKRLCLLRNEDLVGSVWAQEAIPERPLFRFLSRGFTPLRKFGAYELLIRNGHRPRRATTMPGVGSSINLSQANLRLSDFPPGWRLAAPP